MAVYKLIFFTYYIYKKSSIKINKNLKKEVGITTKSKETSGKLAIYVAMKFLTTHSTSQTGYYLCLLMQRQFQLVR